MNQRKFSRLEFVMGVLSLLLNIVGTVLFFVSYTTGYYKFGEMNSPMIDPFLFPGGNRNGNLFPACHGEMGR